MTYVKVDCYPTETGDRRWDPDGPRHITPKRALPFCAAPLGGRMHRVRCVHIYPPTSWAPRGRIIPQPWCGSGGVHMKLYAEPLHLEVCGTCEGRAIGAGQIPCPTDLEPNGLLFSPRLPVMRCTWERASYGYGFSSYGPCRARGKSTAQRGSDVHYVCKQHEYSAFRQGFVLTEGVPLDPNRS